jgi:hypothetical protein
MGYHKADRDAMITRKVVQAMSKQRQTTPFAESIGQSPEWAASTTSMREGRE